MVVVVFPFILMSLFELSCVDERMLRIIEMGMTNFFSQELSQRNDQSRPLMRFIQPVSKGVQKNGRSNRFLPLQAGRRFDDEFRSEK